MVYCTKCGTQNPDTSVNCSNCGSPLFGANAERGSYTRQERSRRYYEEGHYYRRRGSGIGLVIVGLIIMFIGLALFLGQLSLFLDYFWPIVLVFVGFWLLLRGVMRNRRYRQPPSQ